MITLDLKPEVEAGLKAHGIAQILTFNTGYFARYDGIDSVDPKSL
ncbi:MAG TPA: hypothetical protein VG297_09875 [Bryobacteraceae bacterium]|nr:hypothetical protein [Bryobacteraceae bacterium]